MNDVVVLVGVPLGVGVVWYLAESLLWCFRPYRDIWRSRTARTRHRPARLTLSRWAGHAWEPYRDGWTHSRVPLTLWVPEDQFTFPPRGAPPGWLAELPEHSP